MHGNLDAISTNRYNETKEERGVKKALIMLLAAAVCGGVLAWYLFSCGEGKNRELALNGHVDIRSVQVSFRVPGRLASLRVDEGAAVKAGEELARLDAEPYRLARDQAQASLHSAEVSVEQARQARKAADAVLALRQAGYRSEQIDAARATLASLLVARDNEKREFERYQSLVSQSVVSQQEYEAAERRYRSQAAEVEAQEARLAELKAGYRSEEISQAEAEAAAAAAAVRQAEAQVEQARAALAQAELNLSDTILSAPSDAIVMTRTVEPGTMLAAGSGVLTLSLRHPVWVRAYIDEPLLDRVFPGKRVRIQTDGGKRFSGTIGFVSPQAEFTPKTVESAEIRTTLVYRLRIIVDEPCEGLNQGAPVTVHLDD